MGSINLDYFIHANILLLVTCSVDYVSIRGLEQRGQAEWEKHVVQVGGGNVARLKNLPPGCRAGSNDNAFLGGFRLW